MLTVPTGGSTVLWRTVERVEFDKQDLARRLADLAAVPYYDAINMLGHHKGRVLAVDLEPSVAQQWTDMLLQLGLPVAVVHAEDQVGSRLLGNAVRIKYDVEHFEASIDRVSDGFWCPWSAFTLVAVGQVDILKDEHPLGSPADVMRQAQGGFGGGVLGGGFMGGDSLIGRTDVSMPMPLETAKVPEKVLMVELHTEKGVGLSLQARQLTYTHLGERMQASSTDNMRETLREIITHAPQVTRTEAVDKFLEGGLLRAIHFSDKRAFEDDIIWTLQARRQGWLGSAPAEEQAPRRGGRFDSLEL